MTKNFNQQCKFHSVKNLWTLKRLSKVINLGLGTTLGNFQRSAFSFPFCLMCCEYKFRNLQVWNWNLPCFYSSYSSYMSIITSLLFYRERNFQVSRDPLISSKCPRLISPTHWAEASHCDDSTETCRSENQGKDVGSDAGKAPPSWKTVQEWVREAIDRYSFIILPLKDKTVQANFCDVLSYHGLSQATGSQSPWKSGNWLMWAIQTPGARACYVKGPLKYLCKKLHIREDLRPWVGEIAHSRGRCM